MIVVIVK